MTDLTEYIHIFGICSVSRKYLWAISAVSEIYSVDKNYTLQNKHLQKVEE